MANRHARNKRFIEALEARLLLSLTAITDSGTNMLKGVGDLLPVGNTLYAGTWNPSELWTVTNATTHATGLAGIPWENGTDGPVGFAAVGNKVLFSSRTTNSNASTQVLWSSDGTPQGTMPLTSSDVQPTMPLTAFGNKVIYSASTSASGNEPWISDGSVSGTYQLADLEPGAGGARVVRAG